MESSPITGKHLFKDTPLVGSRFDNADLTECEFENVSLARARFDNINLSDVEITDANLRGMKIDGVLVSDLFAAYHAQK